MRSAEGVELTRAFLEVRGPLVPMPLQYLHFGRLSTTLETSCRIGPEGLFGFE